MIITGYIRPLRKDSTQRISSAWPSLYPVPTQRVSHNTLGRVQRIFAQQTATQEEDSNSNDFSTK